MVWRVRRFLRSLKRLLDYAPVIWKNEDWDYVYLLELMAFKIKRMEKNQRQHSHHLHRDRYARQLLICRNLLTRLSKNDYSQKEQQELTQIYGEYSFGKGRSFGRERVTDENKAAYSAAMKRTMEREEYLIQYDLEFFLNTFKKYIFHWWS